MQIENSSWRLFVGKAALHKGGALPGSFTTLRMMQHFFPEQISTVIDVQFQVQEPQPDLKPNPDPQGSPAAWEAPSSLAALPRPSPPTADDQPVGRGHWSDYEFPPFFGYDPRLPPPSPSMWGWGAQPTTHSPQYNYENWPNSLPGGEGAYYAPWQPLMAHGSPPYPGYPQGYPYPGHAGYPAPPRRYGRPARWEGAAAWGRPPRGLDDPNVAEPWTEDDSGAISDTSPAESPRWGVANAGPVPAQWPQPAEPKAPRTVRQRAQGILNRITPASYPRLQEELVQLADGLEEEALAEVARCIHQQAVSAPLHGELYAALCCEVHAAEQRQLADSPQPTRRVVAFRRALLNTCQEFFDNPPQLPADFNELPPQKQLVEEEKLKMQKMGNVQLIAALFKSGLLSERLMELVLQKLLWGPDLSARHRPAEQETVLACTLLDAVGPLLRPSLAGTLYRRLEALREHAESKFLQFRLQDSLERRAARLSDDPPLEVARSA